MGTGAFGRDHVDGSNFFDIISDDLFKNKSSYDSKDFFHIGMEAWGGEQLFLS